MIKRNRNTVVAKNGVNILRASLLGLCGFTFIGMQQPAAASIEESSTSQEKIQKLNSYFERCEEYKICNGTVLVTDGGRLIFSKTMGQVSSDNASKLEANHQFDIGSISKQFTAAAIMRLKDKGILDFDDKMQKYLPDVPYEAVTIRHLLNHTSGVPEAFGFYTQLYRQGKVNENIDNDNLLAVLAREKIPAVSQPSEKWSYNNTGYALLASIVEKVSGKSYGTFLEDEFFAPLGMKSTLVRTPQNEISMAKRTYGFRMTETGQLRAYDQIPFFYLVGAGGLYSTMFDLHKWEQALSGGKVVSKSSWKEATTPVSLKDGTIKEYGFGWGLKPSNAGLGRVSHGGHWRGFKSALEMFPNKGRSIIMLTNNGADDSVDQAVDDVEAILEGAAPSMLKKSVTQDLYAEIAKHGIDAAKIFYSDVMKAKTDTYVVIEREMNRLGYLFLQNKKMAESIAVFNMAAEVFPKSANVYDSLAEAYIADAKNDKAIEAYETVLRLDPEFSGAREKLNKLKSAD